MNDIVVTGIGIISAIGSSVNENREALIKGHCGISTLENFPSRFSGILPCGEIKISTKELKQNLNALQPGVTRTDLLCLHAFRQAIADAGLTDGDLESSETAFINGNTVGGMCLTDELYHDANNQEEGSEYISSYDCSAVTLYIQSIYKMHGIANTINTACSSSANAIMFGARLIQNGLAQRAIVGGVDSLAKFTLNGFNSLHILAPQICKPFDKDRQGLNLGEGAAFLVLEKREAAAGKNIYAKLSGYSNSNDAYHPSSLSPSGEGPYQAMKHALGSAALKPEEISFINTHGTGTENNDEVESKAMIRIFNDVPTFSSTKSNIGHTLGAAGAIEAVYSILNLKHQELYPSLNFSEPQTDTGLIPLREYKKADLKHIMSNSFGFGGNCSSLIFSKA
ncbi:MAG: beta-ketoacyl-[acyl-carrier-protein] synthase family protein [Chitinophagaceae bacterium]|nr:MAG: beta-ketoacyl-[acyl-carrier-protein] synthase family protein [Chitinophagaceae bacterium]